MIIPECVPWDSHIRKRTTPMETTTQEKCSNYRLVWATVTLIVFFPFFCWDWSCLLTLLVVWSPIGCGFGGYSSRIVLCSFVVIFVVLRSVNFPYFHWKWCRKCSLFYFIVKFIIIILAVGFKSSQILQSEICPILLKPNMSIFTFPIFAL